jgi:NAD(P)-dependent dehydrogenase (short-subunit alcohol dehydrogenase family)
MRIDGISALVTGGASGLGLAPARRLIDRGAARVVLVDLPTSPGEESAAGLGSAARFVAADITDDGGLNGALDAAEEAGPLRAVVHCAGRGVTGCASSTRSGSRRRWTASSPCCASI